MSRVCDRPGCGLPASYSRWRADASKPGVTHTEPGMTQEFLCIPHANEVRTYLGGRLEPIPDEIQEVPVLCD